MTQGTSHSSAARRLVVIDGANAIYRAFFAIPSLRAPDGLPTNAAYGFASMLNKVLREESPDFVAVAFDPRGGSFRKRIFDDYKAGRDAQPEDLSAQIPVVRELIEAFRIPLIEIPDFEADDVIAALVKRAPEDVRVTIISTDKDLMQLVSDRVHLLDGVGDRRYGPAEVVERFGVTPDQMLDLRALVGDPSDNIPGVKGIGAKGAAKLIDEWGTLEALIANADQVKTKRAREALLEQADQARLSKRLATLRDDIELGLSWEALAFESPDRDRLRELYKRLGFSRLLAALDGDGEAAETTESASVSVEVVTSAPDFERLMDSLADQRDLCALWISGHGSAVDASLVGVAFAVDDQRAAFVPFVGEGLGATAGLVFEEAHPGLESLFEARSPDSERSWIGSGVKQAQSLLAERGLLLPVPAFDVEVAAFLLDPAGEHQVSALARPMLGRDLSSWEQLAGRGAKAVAAEQLPTESLAHWAGAQVCAIRALHPLLWERLERDELLSLFCQVEMPLTRTLSRMERAGVRINEDKLASLAEEYRGALERLEEEIYRGAGERFLVNSPKQLQVILFEKLKRLLHGRGSARAAGTAPRAAGSDPGLAEALEADEHLHRCASASGERAQRSHPSPFSPDRGRHGSALGLASECPEHPDSNARGHPHPRGLRPGGGFPAAVGGLLPGRAAHPGPLLGRQQPGGRLLEGRGHPPSSAFGLAGQLGIAAAEAQETIDAYFERYRGVRRFIDETIRRAKQQGYVTTLLGRRRYLPDLSSRNRTLRQAAERMATNTVIQGTAADLIKKAMVEVDEALQAGGYQARMILQVHDELVFEVPETEVESLSELARSRMQEVFQLKVPLVVDADVGRNWREAH